MLQSQRGFTLVEIMIAITVFAIGLLAINVMQSASIRGNSVAHLVSGRTTWVSDQIEEILSWNYIDARLLDDGNATSIEGSLTSVDNVYTVTWQVTDDVAVVNSKTITVTVTNTGTVSTAPTAFVFIKPML